MQPDLHRSGFFFGGGDDGSAAAVSVAGTGPLAGGGRHAAVSGGVAEIGAGRFWLKAEWMNPGGSVKDRTARAILRDAIGRGLVPGRRLLDASSGNTGIAYAMLGAAAGIGVTICLPGNASPERRALLEVYGAEVILTDRLEGTEGAASGRASWRRPIPTGTTTRTSTPTRPTRGRTGRPRAPSSGRRPPAGSPISWRRWARREP